MSEDSNPVRKFFVVLATGSSISGVGVGMLLAHWHANIGVFLMAAGALYLLWELLNCRPLVRKVPEPRYYEVPKGKPINREWFNSLFGKSVEEQQQLLDAGVPKSERVQFAP